MTVKNISDSELLTNTKRLVTLERETLAEILLHLAEIHRRKLFSPQYQSLSEYAINELGYSEDEAARRMAAMRLLIDVPAIEIDIKNGLLGLTTLNLARTHFRNEGLPSGDKNATKLELLSTLKGKTKREVLRTLIAQSSCPEKLQHFESTRPISATLNEIRIHAKDETLVKIAQLKGLLAHKHPKLSNGELIDIALDCAIATLDPGRPPKAPKSARQKTDDPVLTISPILPNLPTEPHSPEQTNVRSEPIKSDLTDHSVVRKQAASQSIAAFTRIAGKALKREVWRTGKSCCESCGSNFRLEIDHRSPVALGGLTTKENLRLLCRNCNQREAIRLFGADAVSKKS